MIPRGKGQAIQDSLTFQDKISKGISAYKQAFDNRERTNSIAAVTTLK
jgi:hypothetical protein